MGKTGRTVITRQEIIDPETGEITADKDDEDAELNAQVNLFDLGVIEEKRIAKISVIRSDPAEGHLGNLDPDATETTIKSRWGGGTFRIEAKNDSGRVCKVRSLQIAGDPVFESDIAEARWRRLNGLAPKANSPAAQAVAQKTEDSMSFKELMLLMEQKEEKRQRESEEREERRRREDAEREDRREKAARADHERQLQLLREDTERRDRMTREEAERREKEHDRQMQREREGQTATAQQNQQFFTNMLAMVKQDGIKNAAQDPISIMKSTVEMVSMLKSDNAEPQDAITALINRLPETLKEARETAKAAVREIKGEPAEDGGDGGGSENKDSLTITGDTATQVKSLVRHLVAQGKDPRVFIAGVARAVMTGKRPRGRPPGPIAGRPPGRPKLAPKPVARIVRPAAPPSPRKPPGRAGRPGRKGAAA